MSKSRKTKALKIAVPAVAAAAVVTPALLQAATTTTVLEDHTAKMTINFDNAMGYDTFKDPKLTMTGGSYLNGELSLVNASLTWTKKVVAVQPDNTMGYNDVQTTGASDKEIAAYNTAYKLVKDHNMTYSGTLRSAEGANDNTYVGQDFNDIAYVSRIKPVQLTGSLASETLTFYGDGQALWKETVDPTKGVAFYITSITNSDQAFNVRFGEYNLRYNPVDHRFTVETTAHTGYGHSAKITSLENIKISCAKDYIRIENFATGATLYNQQVDAQSMTNFTYGFVCDGVNSVMAFNGVSRELIPRDIIVYPKAPTFDALSATSTTVAKGQKLDVTIKGADVDANDTINVMCSLDGAAYARATSAAATGSQQTFTHSVSTSSLTAGTHTLKYKLVDAAKNESGEKSLTFTVTIPATAVSLDKTTLALNKGASGTLKATVTPTGTTDGAVSWKSSNNSVATVDQTGKVTAVGGGTATITATCGSKSATCAVTVNVPTTGVSLDKTKASLEKGGSVTLVASVTPGDATDKAIKWTTSNDKVATVDQSGKVTAVAGGTATITATCAGKSATCAITVTVPDTGISLNKDSTTLKIKGTETLTATVTPTDATTKTVTWTTSNDKVATVDTNGKITAVAAGSATITAKTASGKTATCSVTVSPDDVKVTGVTLDKTTLSLKMGATEAASLKAVIAPSNATNQNVTWTSSDPSVATVDGGAVKALKAGTTTITVASVDNPAAKATCAVTVAAADPTDIKVTGVTLDKTTLSLKMGVTETASLKSTVAPTNATNPNVTWTSSDPSVATVDSNGAVKALKAGTTTITVASVANPAAKATCTVTVAAADPSDIKVTGVTLDKTTLSLKMGATETASLKSTIAPANATNPKVTWTSSNPAVATVDSNGAVKALNAGTTTITVASVANPAAKATCTVTVAPADVTPNPGPDTKSHAPVVEITSGSREFFVGEPINLTISISDKDESDEVKIYRLIDNAELDENSPITTKAISNTTISYIDTISESLSEGDHTIAYVAIDSHGNRAEATSSSKVNITVANEAEDFQAAAITDITNYAESSKNRVDASDATKADKEKARNDIDEILSTAVEEIEVSPDEAAAKELVSNAKDDMDSVVDSLSDTPIDNPKDEEALTKAKERAKKSVDELAESAIDVVENYSGLSNSEKKEATDEIKSEAEKAKGKIDNAKDKDEVQKILDDYADTIKDILGDALSTPIDDIIIPEITIDPITLPNIPGISIDVPKFDDIIKDRLQDILDQLKEDLANAKTPEEIQAAIDKALKAIEALKKYAEAVNSSTKNASEYFEKVKDLIEDMPGISSSEKTEMFEKISEIIEKMLEDMANAETAEEVNKIYNEAMDAIKKIYEFAKTKNDACSTINKYVESIKSIIDGMDELSSSEKSEYKSQIDNILEEMLKKLESATTEDEIKKIVADAKDRINSILEKAQSVGELSESKTSANSKVNSFAEDAKKLIDSLSNLSSAEKNKYKSDIEDIVSSALKDIANAKSQEEIDKIVANAKTAIENIVNKAEYENDNISAAPELYISDIESDTFEAGSPIKVTLKVTDSDKDEKISVYYEIDGKKEQLVEKITSKGKAVTVEATLPTDLAVGEHEVVFYAVDEEDNYSNKSEDIEIEDLDDYKASKDKANMITIKIVNTPAEVGITNVPMTIKEGEDVPVNLSVKDNAGQTIKVYYQIDNAWPVAVGDYTSNGTAVPVSFTIPGLKEGTHVLTFYAEDNLGLKSNADGNVSASTLFGTSSTKAINQVTVTVEPADGSSSSNTGSNSAPNVDILTSKTSYNKGEDITINIAVLDKNSNQTITSYYSVDNGGANMIKSYISAGKTDAQSFKLSNLSSGTHTVTVWATDDNGAKSDEFNSITFTVSNETASDSTSTTIKPNQSGTIKTGVESEATGSKGIVAAITGGVVAVAAAAAGIISKKRKK